MCSPAFNVLNRILHRFSVVSTITLLSSIVQASDADISIVYPQENDTLIIGNCDSTFIYGQVLPADVHLEINNHQIPLYEDGTFLAYLPVQNGPFDFYCKAVSPQDTMEITRHVIIPPVYKQNIDSLIIRESSVRPKEDWIVRSGDLIRVSFQGTPHCRACFSIAGIAEHVPMTEESVRPFMGPPVFGDGFACGTRKQTGYYSGGYRLQKKLPSDSCRITFSLEDSAGNSVQHAASGRLFNWDHSIPVVAVTKKTRTKLRTGSDKSYYYFLPKNVKLNITGKQGNFYRIRLAKHTTAWVESAKIKFLPKGTLPPHTHVELIRTFDLPDKSRVIIFTNSRQPFRVDQSTSPSTLLVTLYGVTADTDWIRYDPNDILVKEIRWKQRSDEKYVVRIDLGQNQQWGYNTFYDDHDNLIIDIKKSPNIANWPKSPLYKIHIMLDPGHAPDTGAISPYGQTEAQANLLLANVLKEKLRQKGAIVTATRSDATGRSLYSRQRLAISMSPDILLSLHHNGLPNGVNPFKNRGSSTYYYHPQSYELAKRVQEQLVEKLQLNNYGIFWDNLAMCRPSQFPAVLIEPAFMIHPEEAQLIQSDSYRQKCALAIVKGLETFLSRAE